MTKEELEKEAIAKYKTGSYPQVIHRLIHNEEYYTNVVRITIHG